MTLSDFRTESPTSWGIPRSWTNQARWSTYRQHVGGNWSHVCEGMKAVMGRMCRVRRCQHTPEEHQWERQGAHVPSPIRLWVTSGLGGVTHGSCPITAVMSEKIMFKGWLNEVQRRLKEIGVEFEMKALNVVSHLSSAQNSSKFFLSDKNSKSLFAHTHSGSPHLQLLLFFPPHSAPATSISLNFPGLLYLFACFPVPLILARLVKEGTGIKKDFFQSFFFFLICYPLPALYCKFLWF